MGLGKKQQIGWINCAKFFAILAGVIDHVKGILYEDEAVQYLPGKGKRKGSVRDIASDNMI